MGGTEKRGKPDCGFNFTQICCGPLRSRPQTALQLREMKEVQPYPHQSGSLKEGELGARTEEVPEMGPYRSGVSKSWRPSKTPSHPTRHEGETGMHKVNHKLSSGNRGLCIQRTEDRLIFIRA